MPDYSIQALFVSLVSSIVMGQLVAWTYLWTHAGISYSRAFTQSLVLVVLVATMVMFVIGNNIVTAFGLLGALAIIRFRNNLKDTRDTVFVFFSLVLGMAIGSQRIPEAALGTLMMMAASLYLHWTRFGTRHGFDGHLRLRLAGTQEGQDPVAEPSSLIKAFCSRAKEISHAMDTKGGAEIVYQVRLRSRDRSPELLSALRETEGVEEAGLVLRDDLTEA